MEQEEDDPAVRIAADGAEEDRRKADAWIRPDAGAEAKGPEEAADKTVLVAEGEAKVSRAVDATRAWDGAGARGLQGADAAIASREAADRRTPGIFVRREMRRLELSRVLRRRRRSG